MSQEIGTTPLQKTQILYIFPLVYRPLKINVAKRFALLSQWYNGHIFALSGGKQRNLPVSDFLFHSERSGNNAVTRLFLGVWVQFVVPLQLLWGKSQVGAVIAYDPYRSGLAALVLKYMLRTKLIVELNGDYHRTEPARTYASKVFMRRLFNLVLRGADAIRVLNTDQEAFYRRLLPHTSIYRFPDFVATGYFQSLASHQGDYLLSIGHPFDLKGVDVLIEAFRRVAEKHQQVQLRIMGYCPNGDLEKYRTIARGHPRIAFINPGWIEDVGEQIRSCYALVNAARSEALGRVHIEAMTCGKPIVATRTNGGIQCIEDGQTGLLCEIDDIEDLAAKLDELLSDPPRADRMGQAGKVRMQQMFSEKAYVKAFHTMVEEVVQRTTVS